MSWQDAPLYIRAHDLAVSLNRDAQAWSSAQLAGVGGAVLEASMTLLCSVSLGLAFPAERAGHQRRADHAVQRLRVLLRVAEATGLVSPGAARAYQGELLDMGRMLGGWRKRELRRRSRAPPPLG